MSSAVLSHLQKYSEKIQKISQKVDPKLICNLCKNKYEITDLPRTLSCNKVVCSGCAEKMIKEGSKKKKKFKCQLCKNFHAFPKDGEFPANQEIFCHFQKETEYPDMPGDEPLDQDLGAFIKDLSRAEVYGMMKEMSALKKIQMENIVPQICSIRSILKDNGKDKVHEYFNKLRTDINIETEKKMNILKKNGKGKVKEYDGKDKDHEYFDKLRTDINIETESKMNVLKQNGDRLIKQIDDYEKKCIENIDKNPDMHKRTNHLMWVANNMLTKSTDHLQYFLKAGTDLNIMKHGNEILKDLGKKLVKEEEDVKFRIFMDKKYEFIRSDEVFESLVIGSIRINGKKVEKFDYIKNIKTFAAHTERILALIILPNGDICSASTRKIKIWDRNSQKLVLTLKGHKQEIYNLAVLKNGNLCSCSMDKTIKIWNTETGELIRTLEGHTAAVKSLIILSDGNICSGSYDQTIKIWNSKTGAEIRTLKGHTDHVNCIVELPQIRLASGSSDKKVILWSSNGASTGDLIKILSDHTGGIVGLVLLPNGFLCSSAEDYTVRIWNMDIMLSLFSFISDDLVKTIHLCNTETVLTSLVVLDEENIFGCSARDNSIEIVNFKTERMDKGLYGHRDSVSSIAKCPNGNFVSASFDRTIKIWGK